jgi:hypothetical protein
MTREETLERLRELQRQAQALRRGTDNPAIERTMQILDMYCHMARWQLGDVQAMIPEAEAS